MTSTEERQSGGGLGDTLRNNPAVSRLGEAARDYAKARGTDVVRKVAGRASGLTDTLNEKGDSGGFTAPAVSTALKKVSEGENPVKAAASGVASGVKEKVKSAFGRSGRSQKFMNILEDITVGVPVDVAYNQWTQFQEFASFMKGVDSVDQTDEVTSNWKVKVFKSRRTWKGTVTEQVPDRKIAWSTDGPKGTTKGVVTFHPLADDLTQILLVMEYYPQGLFEKTGNIWRAPGRRARLDLKNFRRFIMMRGEETGSWRGEIRDGQVVRGPEDEDEYEGAESQEEPEDGDEDSAEYEDRDEDSDEDQDQDEDQEYDEDEAEDYEEDEEDEEDEDSDEDEEPEDDEGAQAEQEPEPEPEPSERRPRRSDRGRERAGAGRR